MAACRALLEASCVGGAGSGTPEGRGGGAEGFQVGRSKVFLKGATAAALDRRRAAVLSAAATRLQAAFRCDGRWVVFDAELLGLRSCDGAHAFLNYCDPLV